MKIIIELDDAVLKSAVQAQVGAALAEYTTKALNEKAAEIIATKLDRFSAADAAAKTVAEEVKKVIEAAISGVVGQPGYDRGNHIRHMIEGVIRDRVAEAFKAPK